jgi:hypothetical protein
MSIMLVMAANGVAMAGGKPCDAKIAFVAENKITVAAAMRHQHEEGNSAAGAENHDGAGTCRYLMRK